MVYFRTLCEVTCDQIIMNGEM